MTKMSEIMGSLLLGLPPEELLRSHVLKPLYKPEDLQSLVKAFVIRIELVSSGGGTTWRMLDDVAKLRTAARKLLSKSERLFTAVPSDDCRHPYAVRNGRKTTAWIETFFALAAYVRFTGGPPVRVAAHDTVRIGGLDYRAVYAPIVCNRFELYLIEEETESTYLRNLLKTSHALISESVPIAKYQWR